MSCRIIFVTVSTILLIISAIQLIWFPVSLFSGPMKPRIIYVSWLSHSFITVSSWVLKNLLQFQGVVYHFIGFLLHLAISVNLLTRINLLNNHFYNEVLMRNVVVSLFLCIIYIISGVRRLVNDMMCSSSFTSSSMYLIQATPLIYSKIHSLVFVMEIPVDWTVHRCAVPPELSNSIVVFENVQMSRYQIDVLDTTWDVSAASRKGWSFDSREIHFQVTLLCIRKEMS